MLTAQGRSTSSLSPVHLAWRGGKARPTPPAVPPTLVQLCPSTRPRRSKRPTKNQRRTLGPETSSDGARPHSSVRVNLDLDPRSLDLALDQHPPPPTLGALLGDEGHSVPWAQRSADAGRSTRGAVPVKGAGFTPGTSAVRLYLGAPANLSPSPRPGGWQLCGRPRALGLTRVPTSLESFLPPWV